MSGADPAWRRRLSLGVSLFALGCSDAPTACLKSSGHSGGDRVSSESLEGEVLLPRGVGLFELRARLTLDGLPQLRPADFYPRVETRLLYSVELAQPPAATVAYQLPPLTLNGAPTPTISSARRVHRPLDVLDRDCLSGTTDVEESCSEEFTIELRRFADPFPEVLFRWNLSADAQVDTCPLGDVEPRLRLELLGSELSSAVGLGAAGP